MAAIPMGKTRPKSNPWLIYQRDGWTWRVLKAYSADPRKKYARWFCDVESPFTQGGSDLGDTYIADVVNHAFLVYADPSVPESAIPGDTGQLESSDLWF